MNDIRLQAQPPSDCPLDLALKAIAERAHSIIHDGIAIVSTLNHPSGHRSVVKTPGQPHYLSVRTPLEIHQEVQDQFAPPYCLRGLPCMPDGKLIGRIDLFTWQAEDLNGDHDEALIDLQREANLRLAACFPEAAA